MKKEKKQKNKFWLWPLIAFIMAISISLVFSMLSEWALSSAGTIIAVIVIVVFIALSIVSIQFSSMKLRDKFFNKGKVNMKDVL